MLAGARPRARGVSCEPRRPRGLACPSASALAYARARARPCARAPARPCAPWRFLPARPRISARACQSVADARRAGAGPPSFPSFHSHIFFNFIIGFPLPMCPSGFGSLRSLRTDADSTTNRRVCCDYSCVSHCHCHRCSCSHLQMLQSRQPASFSGKKPSASPSPPQSPPLPAPGRCTFAIAATAATVSLNPCVPALSALPFLVSQRKHAAQQALSLQRLGGTRARNVGTHDRDRNRDRNRDRDSDRDRDKYSYIYRYIYRYRET